MRSRRSRIYPAGSKSAQLTSERLTRIYLDRLDKFNPQLRCAITITRDLALKQAKQADEEIAQGKYRGPLHGIPWGGKDLLDTAGIPTTYGAEPYRNRIPKEDAAVVKRSACGGCGAGCEIEPGRARPQRHLVWRADDESVAAWKKALPDQAPGRVLRLRQDWLDSPSAAKPVAAS